MNRTPRLPDENAFREALLGWFACEGRDYPWRRTHDPYAVLVSEVMLQQTQIATVLGKGYFTRFLERFPDTATLANAGDEPLLKAWEGLGYYRRVRMLRDTARAVEQSHGGKFPSEEKELLDLPGVGRYTANALRAFAFGLPAAVLDGNVIRVLSRVMDFREAVDSTVAQKQLWRWAGELADAQQSRAYNSAIMELGQRICRPGAPLCEQCPVAKHCRAGEPASLPIKAKAQRITRVEEHVAWIRRDDGAVLLACEQGKRRKGLWRLPQREAGELAEYDRIHSHDYTITRYRVTQHAHAVPVGHQQANPGEHEQWFESGEIEALPMTAPDRRAVRELIRRLL